MTSNTIEATAINNDHDDLFAPILPCREVLDHTLSLFHPDGKRLTVEAVENVARTLASMIISSDDETRKPLNVAWKETAASVLKWTNEDSMLFFDFFQLFQSTLSNDNNNNNNNNNNMIQLPICKKKQVKHWLNLLYFYLHNCINIRMGQIDVGGC